MIIYNADRLIAIYASRGRHRRILAVDPSRVNINQATLASAASRAFLPASSIIDGGIIVSQHRARESSHANNPESYRGVIIARLTVDAAA